MTKFHIFPLQEKPLKASVFIYITSTASNTARITKHHTISVEMHLMRPENQPFYKC